MVGERERNRDRQTDRGRGERGGGRRDSLMNSVRKRHMITNQFIIQLKILVTKNKSHLRIMPRPTANGFEKNSVPDI